MPDKEKEEGFFESLMDKIFSDIDIALVIDPILEPMKDIYEHVKDSAEATVEIMSGERHGNVEEIGAGRGYFDAWLTAIASEETGAFLDQYYGIPLQRSVEPLGYYDNIEYPHRAATPVDLETYTRIGDCVFHIPPTFIQVVEQSTSERLPSIRQNGTTQVNQGHSAKELVLHLFFNGEEQLNGFEVDGPHFSKNYVDGLRPLLSQFLHSPFLSIENTLINGNFNVFAVSLLNLSVQTVQGFPGCVEVVLNLLEFTSEPYTLLPNAMFDGLIDWDLFRYNYQRKLQVSALGHVTKRGNLPLIDFTETKHDAFEIMTVNDSVFGDENAPSSYIEDMFYKDSSYTRVLTDGPGVHLVALDFGLSNILPSIQMEGHASRVTQYFGNTDTHATFVLEVTDRDAISQITALSQTTKNMSRMYRNYAKIGFVRIKNPYINATGSEHFVIENIDMSTVPDFPGLYRVTISLVSFKISQQSDSTLYGARPFANNRKGTMADGIYQSVEGLYNKVRQDNEIEKRMVEGLQLYPELDLPKMSELDAAIKEIRSFRSKHKLTGYPLSVYPRESFHNVGSAEQELYNGWADPDYYFFYPMRFDGMDAESLAAAVVSPIDNNAETVGAYQTPDHKFEDNVPDISGRSVSIDANLTERAYSAYEALYGTSYATTVGGFGGYSANGPVSPQKFVDLCCSKAGCRYILGNEGQYVGGIQTFDCSGLISWAFWQFGEWKNANGTDIRMYTWNIHELNLCYEVPFNQMQMGDLCWVTGHIGVVTGKLTSSGKHQTIEAMNPTAGVTYGVVEGYYTKILRPYALSSVSANTTFSTSSQKAPLSVQVNNPFGSLTNFVNIGSGPSLEDVNKTTETPTETPAATPTPTPTVKTDMTYDSTITASVLSQYLGSGAKTGLRGYAAMIWEAAKKYNLDPALLCAISILETGWGTSPAFLTKNNPGGIMSAASEWTVLVHFGTIQEGFDFMASNLARNYINIGLVTLTAIGNKYCPIGAENDPTGLNANWIPSVTKFYTEIKALGYGVATGDIKLDSSAMQGFVSAGGDVVANPTPYIPAYGRVPLPSMLDGVKDHQAGQYLLGKHAAYTFTGASKATSQLAGDTNIVGRVLDRLTFAPADVTTDFIEAVPNQVLAEYNKKIRSFFENFGRPCVTPSLALRALIEKTGARDYDDFMKGKRLTTFVPVIEPETPEDGETRFEVRESDELNESVNEFLESDTTIGASIASREYREKVALAASGNVIERLTIEEITQDKLLSYMSVDAVSFNKRGRLCRAFPTFVFAIVDTTGQWLDGRKLWSNYYFYRSVIDIQVFQEMSQPVHTAYITVNDAYDRLSHSPLIPYELYEKTRFENEASGYNLLQRKWYEWTGSLLGTPNMTESLVDVKNYLFETARISEGCRLHIRMGYGSNPALIPTVFNGTVGEIEQQESTLRFTAQSDGAELLSHLIISDEDNKDVGKVDMTYEPSNIVASILHQRENRITNNLSTAWGEASAFGIESFGLPFNTDWSLNLNYSQYDLVRNIHVGAYDMAAFSEYKDGFVTWIQDGGDESNLNYQLDGKYPWDCFQMSAQVMPDFVAQPSYHQFESRLFYGLPWSPHRYRYDIKDPNNLDTWTDSVKTFAQVHMLTSATDIIRNKMKATRKDLKTNIIGLYKAGSDSRRTPVIYSDRTMDWMKQSASVIDTTVTTPFQFLELARDILMFDTAKDQAQRVCLSNLISYWQQTYSGSISVIGDSAIKPCDYIYLNDSTKDVRGAMVVRNVVHSMNGSTGFMTTITPGMLVTTPIHDSGSVNVYKSIIGFFGPASSLVEAHKMTIDYLDYTGIARITRGALSVAGIVGTVAFYTTAVKGAKFILTTLKSGTAFKTASALYTSAVSFTNTIATAQKIKTGVTAAKNAVTATGIFKAGAAAVSAVPGGAVAVAIGVAVMIVSQVVMNKLFHAVFDYFTYSNSIKILPIVKDGSYFCVSTSGAQKLILGDENAMANNTHTLLEDTGEVEL